MNRWHEARSACGSEERSGRAVARKVAEYNLIAVPVVDDEGDLVGVVTVDDAMDLLLPEEWRPRVPKVYR